MSELRIGTSGWSYPSWRGPFFPKEVRVKDHLAYYATQFDATELNAGRLMLHPSTSSG